MKKNPTKLPQKSTINNNTHTHTHAHIHTHTHTKTTKKPTATVNAVKGQSCVATQYSYNATRTLGIIISVTVGFTILRESF